MAFDTELGADASEDTDLRASLMAAFKTHAEPAEAPLEAPIAETEAPAGETDAERAARLRDEKGRFAKGDKAAAVAAEAPKVAAAEAPQTKAEAPQADAELVIRPPNGWSPEAKAAFAEAPPAIQQAVVKREAEVNKGFEKLADYKGLERFVDMAKAENTTVAGAMERFYTAQAYLQKDFAGGVRELAGMYKVHPVQAAAGLLGVDVNALVHALRGGQGQAQTSQPGQAPHGVDPRLAQEFARRDQVINHLLSEAQARQRAASEEAYKSSSSVVSDFFNDPAHTYAYNLENEIFDLIKRDPNARQDQKGALKRAYETALYLNPETRELAIQERIKARQAQALGAASTQTAAAAKARQASRSLTGSPVTGAAVTGQPAPSIREELQRAFGANRA